jgi:WD40 repeat protein
VQLVRADTPQPVAVAAGRAGIARPGPEPLWLDPSTPVSFTPRRTLAYDAFPGIFHAVYAPARGEILAATAKRLVRWTPDVGTADVEFSRRAGTDGVAARFSPDLSVLVTFRGEKDVGLVVRDAPYWAEQVAIPTRVTEPRYLAVAPAAAWVATLPRTPERTVAVRDGRTGAERFTRPLEDSASCLASTPDGRAIAAGVSDLGRGVNNKVVFFDAATGERLFTLPTHRKAVTALAFTADGRHLAVGFNGLIQRGDVPARELVRTAGGFERVPMCLTFAPTAGSRPGCRTASCGSGRPIWGRRCDGSRPACEACGRSTSRRTAGRSSSPRTRRP